MRDKCAFPVDFSSVPLCTSKERQQLRLSDTAVLFVSDTAVLFDKNIFAPSFLSLCANELDCYLAREEVLFAK